jgi:hypothetical protein
VELDVQLAKVADAVSDTQSMKGRSLFNLRSLQCRLVIRVMGLTAVRDELQQGVM